MISFTKFTQTACLLLFALLFRRGQWSPRAVIALAEMDGLLFAFELGWTGTTFFLGTFSTEPVPTVCLRLSRLALRVSFLSRSDYEC